jgi:hypothetical protein
MRNSFLCNGYTKKLLSIIWEECGYKDPSLDYCSPEMFGKLRIPELEEFILACDLPVTLKKDMPGRKGKLSEAREAIESGVPPENNRIYCAYQCQNELNKLKAKHQTNNNLETGDAAANQLETRNEVLELKVGAELK